MEGNWLIAGMGIERKLNKLGVVHVRTCLEELHTAPLQGELLLFLAGTQFILKEAYFGSCAYFEQSDIGKIEYTLSSEKYYTHLKYHWVQLGSFSTWLLDCHATSSQGNVQVRSGRFRHSQAFEG